VSWILQDTIHRANNLALGLVEMAYALGAQSPIDLVDLLALVDGLVGALGLTHIAVYAFIVDQKRHT